MSKLCLYVFHKNLRPNLILICQIVMTALVLNLMIGHINLISYTSSMFAPLSEQDGGVYMPVSSNKNIHARLMDSEYIDSISIVEQYLVYYQGKEIPMFVYDDKVSDFAFPKSTFINTHLNGGKSEEEIPVFITGNKLGILPGSKIAITDHEGNSAKVEILGLFESPTFIFNLDFASNRASPNSLYRYYNHEYFGYPVMATTKEALKNSMIECVRAQHSSLVFFAPEIDEEDKINIISELNHFGEFATFDEISSRGQEYRYEVYKQYTPYFVCAISISIIGLLGLAVLTLLKSMKIISVLYILGCPWKRCSLLCFGNSVINAFISVTIIGLVIYFGNIISPLAAQGVVIEANNFYISVCIFILFFIISAITPHIMLLGSPPIKFLKEIIKD